MIACRAPKVEICHYWLPPKTRRNIYNLLEVREDIPVRASHRGFRFLMITVSNVHDHTAAGLRDVVRAKRGGVRSIAISMSVCPKPSVL